MYKNVIRILSCFILIISLNCQAQNQSVKTQDLSLKNYKENNIADINANSSPQIYHLKTGHTVVIKENHTNPIVTVDTWVKTGTLNENSQNNGVSHFLEHLMFKGTKNYKTGEIDKILESKGGKFNAATSKDFTHFYITIPSKEVETAIKLNAEMLINANFPEEELNEERKVVQEEIRRSEDNPNSKLFDNLISIVFKTHPYKYKTLGTQKIIENIPRNEIIDYYQKYYVPSNLITVVVGDVYPKQILCMIEKNYRPGVSKPVNLPKFQREPDLLKPETKIVKDKINFGYLFMGFKGVPVCNIKESYALDLAASILGGGKSSRLYQNIKEKQNITSSIDAGHYSLRDDSIFYISADFEPSKYEKVKQEIENELKILSETKVTDEELNRAKTQEERAYLYENESVEDVAGTLGYVMAIEGNIDSYNNHLKNVNAVTAEDIQSAVQKYVKSSKMALSVLLPTENKVKNENKTSDAANKNVKQVNNLKNNCTPKPFNKNPKMIAEKTVLQNGMVLITNPNTSNEIISLSVFVKGGKLLDSPPGITNLLVKTLMQGTKTRSALEITKAVEDLGIVISPNLDTDCFEIRLKSTKQDFDKAFEILVDVINNPAFYPEYVEKEKKNIIQDITKSRDKPMSRVSEAFTRAMYPNQPYGNVGEVLEKSVPSLTREQLIDFHKRIFIPQNMVTAVSGNVNKAEIIQKFTENFACECGEKIVIKASQTVKKISSNKEIIQNQETSASWMLIGWPVDSIYNTKEYVSLQIINSILSGGMSSRLFGTFREKQGLAYSVGSYYSSRLDGSYFAMYIGTEPKNIELVKNKFLQEMTRLKTEKISSDELNDAKQKLIGDYLLSQETNADKAHNLGWFEIIDKGFKFTYDFPDLINSVTSEDVMNASNKYFNSPYVLSIVAPKKSENNKK